MSGLAERARNASLRNSRALWPEQVDGCESLLDELADEIERLELELSKQSYIVKRVRDYIEDNDRNVDPFCCEVILDEIKEIVGGA